MSDAESLVDENVDPVDGADGSGTPKLTYEELEAELAKTRREAGSRRQKNKELDESLAKFREWEKSQMTELERAKAEKAEVDKQLAEVLRERNQAAAGRKAKLDPDLYDRIHGSTEEEMLEDAKRLAKRYPADTSAPPTGESMFAGKRGGPVGGGNAAKSPSEAFRELFTGGTQQL